jgi:flagellar biogenesis protein FliO
MFGNQPPKILRWLTNIKRAWHKHPSRQLCLRETLMLGDRRFISVVEFEQQRFLIAGTSGSVVMLTALPGEVTAREDLQAKAGDEGVPTWIFARETSVRQLIRS